MVAALGGAVAFAMGNPALGGVLVLTCAVLDALDGMVARARGTASRRGRELIDAAVDRYAEIATFAGIAAYYRSFPLGFWLALSSLGGALLVSYARAKGEISGIDARMGSMNRGERALYIGLAGLIAPDLARWLEAAAMCAANVLRAPRGAGAGRGDGQRHRRPPLPLHLSRSCASAMLVPTDSSPPSLSTK